MTDRTAGLYVRTSTSKQTPENQLPDLERMVRSRGYTPRLYGNRPVMDVWRS